MKSHYINPLNFNILPGNETNGISTTLHRKEDSKVFFQSNLAHDNFNQLNSSRMKISNLVSKYKENSRKLKLDRKTAYLTKKSNATVTTKRLGNLSSNNPNNTSNNCNSIGNNNNLQNTHYYEHLNSTKNFSKDYKKGNLQSDNSLNFNKKGNSYHNKTGSTIHNDSTSFYSKSKIGNSLRNDTNLSNNNFRQSKFKK